MLVLKPFSGERAVHVRLDLQVSGVAHQVARMLSEQRLRLDAEPAQDRFVREADAAIGRDVHDQRGKRIGDQPQLPLAGMQTLGQVVGVPSRRDLLRDVRLHA